MKIKWSLFIVVFVFLSGCVSPPLYSWGKYENSLYKYYKNPEGLAKYTSTLERTIKTGETKGNVAPGLYGELGYIYLEQGDSKNAVYYFSKEKEAWPESAHIMDRLIQSAQFSSDSKESS